MSSHSGRTGIRSRIRAVVCLLSLVCGLFVMEASVGAVAAFATADHCGALAVQPGYNGTSAQRKASHRDIQDPVKQVNYPCAFDPKVRGIRIDPGSILLVAGGQLVRTVPLAATRGTVTLPQIIAAVHDPSWIEETSPGTVLLSAGLIQEPGTRLLIAAPAVQTLRILGNPGDLIGGTKAELTIKGVAVTSWDPKTQAPLPTPVANRPFLYYENASTLNTIDSSFSYLGTDATSSYGVAWGGDTAGLAIQCIFQHNFFGAYTFGAKKVIIENNIMRYNTYYGIDPHTYSSDLTIAYNDVYGNGDHGIVFSRYVTGSTVEYNNSHDNKANGIMMDLHSDNNVIRYNTVTHNGEGIVFSGSGKNDVYGNTVSDNIIGIRASNSGADQDNLHDNVITGGAIGIQLYGGATSATLTNNTISGAAKFGIVVDAPRSVLQGNQVSGAATGVKLETVATMTGGSLQAQVSGISVSDEAFADISGVQVQAAKPALVTGNPVVHLFSTRFRLPSTTTGVTLLDEVGVAILCFALLCEIIHLIRRLQVRRMSASLAGGGPVAVGPDGVFLFTEPKGLRRAAIKSVRVPEAPTAVDPGSTPAPDPAGSSGQRRFRPDIEGLRALAVIAVIVSHASLGLPGGYVGVDVFFVISGFLITRQLMDEADRTGRAFSFARFYARRARRILPAATVVIIATLVASYAWAAFRFASIDRDGIVSALFTVNWRMAAEGTNYFQASGPPSPFQHYWSLSVEEQFYIVWPILLAGLLLAFRGRLRKPALVTALTAIIAVSLWASVVVTKRSQPYGYFGTHTRVWELAAGALVAVAANRLCRLPRAAATLMAWAGLAGVVLACVFYSSSTAYPGFAAVLPVGAAALLLCAGCGAAAKFGPERMLALWPLRWTGRLSYSLYLWHWPLLVLLPLALGHSLSLNERLSAVAIAFVLSVLTYAWVEQPVRQRRVLIARPRRALVMGSALMVCSVVTALILETIITTPGGNQPATTPVLAAALAADTSDVGAGSSLASAIESAASQTQLAADVTPTLAQAPNSFPDTNGCEVGRLALVPKLPCDQFGDPTGTKQVVLIGDSHAGMWLNGVAAVAKSSHWKLAVFTKVACPVANYPDLVDSVLKRTYTECNAWRNTIIARIGAMKPALVIVASEQRNLAVREPTGMQTSVQQLEASGAKVAFLGDAPAPNGVGDVPECLANHSSDIQACSTPRPDAFLPGRAAEMHSAQRAGATVIDPTPWFCTSLVCPAVINNIIVFEDDGHITGTYGGFLAPELAQSLNGILS